MRVELALVLDTSGEEQDPRVLLAEERLNPFLTPDPSRAASVGRCCSHSGFQVVSIALKPHAASSRMTVDLPVPDMPVISTVFTYRQRTQ